MNLNGCERPSASAACVAERSCGAASSGLRGRGTQWMVIG
jgi:hypothetical protein